MEIFANLIYPVTYDFLYDAALSIAQMASLFDRREQLNRHFFQAEDGIRDATVTGVQTCALPI